MVVLAQHYIVEPHYNRAVDQFELLPVEPGDTVFLGDSLTEFGTWSALFPNTRVRNRGIAGDDTAGVLARLDELTAGKPARVFLMIGTNDLTYAIREEQIVANITTIVSRIQDQSWGTEIFVQSVLPRNRDFRERVESLNRKLRMAISRLLGEGYRLWRDLIRQHVEQSR